VENRDLRTAFASLSTPLVADACLRLGLPIRSAPPGILPIVVGMKVAGRALPVRHFGSVDVFLEAIDRGEGGDVLVIDNSGRLDEGCIGDLTALEARSGALSGIVLWGLHRDTAELLEIGFPVFSYGRCPAGPTRLDPHGLEAFSSARFGPQTVERSDAVFADDDGVVFVGLNHAARVVAAAGEIRGRERRQAEELKGGKSLREQFRFSEFLARRESEPQYTLRQHLREIGGAIEE
jgi:regulator of RNase E activity RraA